MTMFAVPEHEERLVRIPGRHRGIERLYDGVLSLPWIGVGDSRDERAEGGVDEALALPWLGQSTHGMGGLVGDPAFAGRLGHDLTRHGIRGGLLRMATVAEDE